MASSTSLLGRRVKLVVSDPWDFVTDNGSGPFEGEVVQEISDAILVKLDTSIEDKGETYEFLVVSTRHAAEELSLVLGGNEVSCNATAISNERAQGPTPCDLSWWRGGLAVLAALSVSTTRPHT